MNAVKEWFSRLWDKIKTFWSAATRLMKALIVAVAVGVLALIIALIVWVTHVEYVYLASGLSQQEYANVMSVLAEVGIEPEITNTGVILVREEDANRARMQIAQRVTGEVGYEIVQGLGITATQADKNQADVFLTQERVRGMIESYDEIDRAVVEYSIPQPSIYRIQGDNLPKTASVKITKRPGAELTPEQIQAIINIVRFAEAGLLEENIAISDENGDLKAQLKSGNTTSKLQLTEQVNTSVKNRLLQGLQPVYGRDNVTIAVNSILNTDEQKTTETTYIPFDEENPQNNPLDLRERDYEQVGPGDPAAEGVPGVNDNADIPQYNAEDIDVTDGDNWRMHDIYDYLVSSVVNEIVKEGLEITDMSVAVLINNENLPDTERDKVVDWVSGATGLAATQIRVQGMRFQDISTGLGDAGLDLRRILLISGLALLALIVLFIIIFLNIQKRNKERHEAELEALAAEAAGTGDMSLVDLMGEEPEYEPIQLVETQEQKLKAQIRDLAVSDPEIVAQLIKTWLVNS